MDHVAVIVIFSGDCGIGLKILDIRRAVRVVVADDLTPHFIDLLLLNRPHLLVDRLKLAVLQRQLTLVLPFDYARTVLFDVAVEKSDRFNFLDIVSECAEPFPLVGSALVFIDF